MKKVLIITYYWPPAGGPGVQRILKFAKFLPDFGWEPIILTVNDGEYPAIDHSLVNEIPKNCKVFKSNSFEPNNIYRKLVRLKNDERIPVAILAEKNAGLEKKIANWIRLNLFIPDAKIGWKYFAVNKGKKIIDKHNPDLIFSSSPPPTVHLIGKSLANYSNLKWVADFRDPWTDIYYYQNLKKNKFSSSLDKYLELSVLKNADQVCTVSRDLELIFKRKYPEININIVTNGFDPEDFPKIRSKERYGKFTIAYAGKLNNQQNPINLWQALQNLINKNEQFSHDFQMIFMGNFSDDIYRSIENHNLKPYLIDLGYVEHSVSLKNLKKSSIKLLIIPNTTQNKGIITGKLFEYLATDGFILGIGSKDGDAAKILEETGAGKVFEYTDDLAKILANQYNIWKNGSWPKMNVSSIEKYSRKNLTKNLTNIFGGKVLQ